MPDLETVIPKFGELMRREGFLFAETKAMGPLYFEPRQGIVRLYHPDLMINRGIGRLGGSIGFSLIDALPNEEVTPSHLWNLDSNKTVSIRIENSPNLIRMGGLAVKRRSAEGFIDALMEFINSTLPENVNAAKDLYGNSNSWLRTVINAERSQGSGKYSELRSALTRKS